MDGANHKINSFGALGVGQKSVSGVDHIRTSHVYLDLEAFIPWPDFKQEIDVRVNEKSVGRASFDAADNRKVISFQVLPTRTEAAS